MPKLFSMVCGVSFFFQMPIIQVFINPKKTKYDCLAEQNLKLSRVSLYFEFALFTLFLIFGFINILIDLYIINLLSRAFSMFTFRAFDLKFLILFDMKYELIDFILMLKFYQA